MYIRGSKEAICKRYDVIDMNVQQKDSKQKKKFEVANSFYNQKGNKGKKVILLKEQITTITTNYRTKNSKIKYNILYIHRHNA